MRRMRRFIVLATVVLVMTAMLLASAAPALASIRGGGGTPAPAEVCESDLATSPSVGWRNGQCWVFHPAATSLL
jgi:hypothetical protein